MSTRKSGGVSQRNWLSRPANAATVREAASHGGGGDRVGDRFGARVHAVHILQGEVRHARRRHVQGVLRGGQRDQGRAQARDQGLGGQGRLLEVVFSDRPPPPAARWPLRWIWVHRHRLGRRRGRSRRRPVHAGAGSQGHSGEHGLLLGELIWLLVFL